MIYVKRHSINNVDTIDKALQWLGVFILVLWSLQLTAHVGEVEISKPKKVINYLDYQAKEPDIDMSGE